jgi:hypothetical protein
MVRFVRGAVVALFLVSSSLASAVTIDLGPSDFSRLGTGTATATATGVRHSVDGVVRFPGGRIPDFTVTRNQLVPLSGVTNGLKSLVRSTPGAVVGSAALTALFAGIDWVIDSSSGVPVLSRNSPTVVTSDPSNYRWQSPLVDPPVFFPSPLSACEHTVVAVAGYTAVVGVSTHGGNGNGICTFRRTDGTLTNFMAPRSGSACNTGHYQIVNGVGGCYQTGLVPVQETDWSTFPDYLGTKDAATVASTAGILIGAGVDPADMSLSDDVITGPVTVVGETTTSTSVDSEGNTTVTSETTTHEFAYSPTEVTNTGSTTATDVYTNGNLSSSTTTTTTTNNSTVENEYNSSGLDIPTDCEFMPTVCAFLDWFKEPIPMPDPEFPQVGEFEDTTDGFSVDFGGSCPEPYLIELSLFPPVSFSWQPLCSFAGYMKPMVIISALIFAAYISLGISRGNS